MTTFVPMSASKVRRGAIVIVIDGDKGPGFSCQADLETLLTLPAILEDVAKQMRDGMSSVPPAAAARPDKTP